MRVSKPLTLALGAALAILSSCGPAGDDVAATSAAASARALETSNAGGDKFARVGVARPEDGGARPPDAG
jgi:hypothetical protein